MAAARPAISARCQILIYAVRRWIYGVVGAEMILWHCHISHSCSSRIRVKYGGIAVADTGSGVALSIFVVLATPQDPVKTRCAVPSAPLQVSLADQLDTNYVH